MKESRSFVCQSGAAGQRWAWGAEMDAVLNYLSLKYCDIFDCVCNGACAIDGELGVTLSCGAVSEAQ